jgi:hypothetical protein
VIIAKQNGWPVLVVGPNDLLAHLGDQMGVLPLLDHDKCSIWLFDTMMDCEWRTKRTSVSLADLREKDTEA